MHRFYAPGLVFDREVELPPDEAHHLARVLRLEAGSHVAVFDGQGNEAVACIQTVGARRVTVKAVERRVTVPEPGIALTLAQALLKSDKMDRVIRDAVMLGVTAIQPFISHHTDVPLAAVRAGGRRERWDRTVISSVKQCGRAVVPAVHPTLEFSALLEAVRDTLCVMCVEPGGLTPVQVRGSDPQVATLQSLETRVPAKATVLIGPEGGWAPQEVTDAVAAGVTLVTLGQRVLRADAAGAIAVAILQYVWKDL